LTHGIRENAVQFQNREQQRHGGEARHEHERKPLAGDAAADCNTSVFPPLVTPKEYHVFRMIVGAPGPSERRDVCCTE
jgi:hypothetical protein